ncbi:DEAD/DEAH box helicase [Williamsia sp. CHRR-6]|uniref:DEAD/DEAH box helicase n=1 Tax=Williamsia sp. CHRR-6 TaxID=2835871 RepID=UPI001BDAF066|nr:DEAD/DEAH box helicase [Williamsia sp. CHRR-6]MBT0565581.1 DEAD/DEAH box helicase [Williamsia sp. CHRR-6]
MPERHTVTSTDFITLGVPAALVDALGADGKTTAFPIQVDTLPDTLAGRDVLGRGKTGSGKTLAFSIPLVARIADGSGPTRRRGRPRALVLAPTRELATQIQAVIDPLAAAYSLRTTTIFGGVNQKRQVDALQGGVDIVVACPGRLEDLLDQRHLTLDEIEITVIDEADHMADLGFLPAVTRILTKTPQGGQRLLFSATLDNGVDKLVHRFMQQPVMHSVDEANSPVAAMTHHVFEVADTASKNDLVEYLASGVGRRILFMRTKHQAKKLAKKLTASGIPAVDLHGNLSQPQRDRNLAAFGEGSVRVLVATDVAARGVHVDDVELVIHVDPPAEHKAYLHRSGRTARAGNAGDVVTIALPEQRADLRRLLKKADIDVAPHRVSAASAEVVDLVGDRAPHVTPAPEKAPAPAGSGSRRRPAGAGARSTRGGGSGRSAQPRGDRSTGSRAGAPRRGSRPMHTSESGASDGSRSGRNSGSRAGARADSTERSSTQRSSTQRSSTQRSSVQRAAAPHGAVRSEPSRARRAAGPARTSR